MFWKSNHYAVYSKMIWFFTSLKLANKLKDYNIQNTQKRYFESIINDLFRYTLILYYK